MKIYEGMRRNIFFIPRGDDTMALTVEVCFIISQPKYVSSEDGRTVIKTVQIETPRITFDRRSLEYVIKELQSYLDEAIAIDERINAGRQANLPLETTGS